MRDLSTDHRSGNYRALLATADQVVQLESQASDAEHHISDLSTKCHSPNTALKAPSESLVSARTTVGHLSLIYRCLESMSRLLKLGEILLSAKLLALCKLLHRVLATQNQHLKTLPVLQQRIASLQRHILKAITARFTKAQLGSNKLVETGCAFCLVTNSSANDALQHYRALRLKNMQEKVEDLEKPLSATAIFQYYVRTLRSLAILQGQVFQNALKGLQAHAILKDPRLSSLRALSMQNIGNGIAQEILQFAPYIKHDSLPGEDADTASNDWSKSMLQRFREALQKATKLCTSLQDLFKLRVILSSMWFATCLSLAQSMEIFSTIRQLLNAEIQMRLATQVNGLSAIGSTLARIMRHKSAPESLWLPDLASRQVKSGGTAFLNELQSRNLGLSSNARSSLKQLQAWISQVETCRSLIGDAKTIRWRDKVDDDEDDMAQDQLASIIESLSQSDPQSFEHALNEELEDARKDLTLEFEDLAGVMDDADHIPNVLRLFREVNQRLRHVYEDEDPLGAALLLPKLHERLAKCIAEEVDERLRPGPKRSVRKRKESDSTNGMPTPQGFKTLMHVCQAMSDLGGSDIWSPDAVAAVKAAIWDKIQERQDDSQSQFDRAYLAAALQPVAKKGESTVNGIDHVQTEAAEYWKRTRLLFELLA